MATVYVGMSGGVDSSVTAALLKQQGYSVVGVYMQNWTQDVAGVACPWQRDLADARAVAAMLDIPFKVFDFQQAYRERVVESMVAEYAAGRTPNPDVMCNQEIKFRLFLDTAVADGADFIATGHYAATHNGQLLRAQDEAKDQTYFLYRVSEAALRRTLFPLGGLTKPEVRRLALAFGLPTATKPDSQGICFVGEVGIKPFLKQYLQAEPGPVVEQDTGKVLGMHDGALFVTIGQRHGLGIGGGKPWFVCAKDITTNTVYVTDATTSSVLAVQKFWLQDESWVGPEPNTNETYLVRLRHRGQLHPARLSRHADGWMVALQSPAVAVADGQSAVVYAADVVLGGGLIKVMKKAPVVTVS